MPPPPPTPFLYQLATPSPSVDTQRWMSCALRKMLCLGFQRLSMFHARYKLSARTGIAKFWIRHDSVQMIDWLLHLGVFTGVPESQTSSIWTQAADVGTSPTCSLTHGGRNEDSREQDRIFQRALLNKCITTCFGVLRWGVQGVSCCHGVEYMHDITPSTLVILKNYWHRFNGCVRILNNSLHLVFCIR
jgi:hypothetical protein